MRAATADLNFETTAHLRDEIKRLQALELGLDPLPPSGHEASAKADWKPKPLGSGGYEPDKRSTRTASRGAPRRKKAG